MRYRLRFVLQELDLPPGGTIIGRSLDCHLTLEDPLVSRRHARIFVDDAGARIEDMGSRNGVRVNGAVIREPIALRNGDRIRIGTQDFVFCCVDARSHGHSKTTGHLRLCANCRLPYPRELLACPNCEATEQTDDDTLTGSGRSMAHSWNVQLVVESLERALSLGRLEDAERIVQRAVAQVEELVGSGGWLDDAALAALANQLVATTLALDDPHWAHWVVTIYGRGHRIPPPDVVDRLVEVGTKYRALMLDAIGDLLRGLEERSARGGTNGPGGERSGSALPLTQQDLEAVIRLEELRRTLELEDSGAPPAAPPSGTRYLPTA